MENNFFFWFFCGIVICLILYLMGIIGDVQLVKGEVKTIKVKVLTDEPLAMIVIDRDADHCLIAYTKDNNYKLGDIFSNKLVQKDYICVDKSINFDEYNTRSVIIK